jgi:hypothetical protein
VIVTQEEKRRSVVIDSGMRNLAARVAAKIEEGDVRGAMRLTVSNDTLAACRKTSKNCVLGTR